MKEDQARATDPGPAAKWFRVRYYVPSGRCDNEARETKRPIHVQVSAADYLEAGLAVANEYQLGDGARVDVAIQTPNERGIVEGHMTIFLVVRVNDQGERRVEE